MPEVPDYELLEVVRRPPPAVVVARLSLRKWQWLCLLLTFVTGVLITIGVIPWWVYYLGVAGPMILFTWAELWKYP